MKHIPSYRHPGQMLPQLPAERMVTEAATPSGIRIYTPSIPEWRKKKINEAYRVKLQGGYVTVRRDPYNDGNFTETVSLPSQVAEISDAVDAYICDVELTIRRRSGKAFAWNIRTLAPLGPR
ncbi:MAG: hypothetical protein ACOY3I_05885 [Verrucomicrobiota bacterium]